MKPAPKRKAQKNKIYTNRESEKIDIFKDFVPRQNVANSNPK